MTKLTQQTTNRGGDKFHFFASSIADWRTGTDLVKLINQMKKLDYPFNVFKVELPEDASYRIRMYQPDVPDDQITFVAFWDKE